MLMVRHLLRWWPNLAWYAGRFGTTASVGGCRITAPSRYLAGIVRLGEYEKVEQAAIRRFLDPSLPVIELGAGIGLIACLANKRLQQPAAHLCVDGNKDALALAASNGAQNGCGFSTLHGALAYDTATVVFGCDENILGGGIGARHPTVEVPAVTLSGLIARTGFERCSLICDIEGAELSMVEREGDCLRAHVPRLILEAHPGTYGLDGVRTIEKRLRALGYRCLWTRETVTVWDRRGS